MSIMPTIIKAVSYTHLDVYKRQTSKYAKLAKCSPDTALRDILLLVERGILVRNPEGGRSTSYALALNPTEPEVVMR